MLIAVDGLDGCGKDTHALRIKRLFEEAGRQVVIISHPSERRFGRWSKASLQRTGHTARLLATLFYTADVLMSVRWLSKKAQGTVIFVRYLLGTAYLPEKLAPIGYEFFRKLLPFPDLALFIDIEPSIALRRIERRDQKREMFETPQKLESVRAVAKRLAEKEWITVDNSEEGDAPFMVVETLVRERLLS